MYEVSDGRPRGTSSSPSARELPILFHLVDVSRPRAKPAEKQLEKPMGEPAHILAAVESLHPAIVPEAVAAAEPAAAKPAAAPAAIDSLTPPSVKLEAPASPVVVPAASAEPAVALPPAAVPEVVELKRATEQPKVADTPKTSEVAASAENVPAAPSPAKKEAVVHPVSLRKKNKTSASEDWFASHGKFIAIAFVVALGATVYFARTNRERATAAMSEPAAQPPLIEDAPPATGSGEQNLWPETLTNNNNAGNAATPVQTASSTESKVELLAPQLVAEAPAEKRKDNLFEFAAAKSDERVAARSEETAKGAVAAPALGAPAAPSAPAEPTNYPVTSPTASRYPVTNPPAAAYPATARPTIVQPSLPANAPIAPPQMPSSYPAPTYQPAPQAGPSIDYRSQYPAAPAPPAQQQAWPPAGYGGQPGSYQPFDNTARGQRNERTGSGTY